MSLAFKRKNIPLDELNRFNEKTLAGFMGMQVVNLSDDSLTIQMEVRKEFLQPFGIMHGGTSLALAEQVGSLAGYLSTDDKEIAVGLSMDANHIRPGKEGDILKAVAKPIHTGRRTMVWNIQIVNQKEALICTARFTMMVQQIEKVEGGK